MNDLLQTVALWRTKVRAAVDSTGRTTELLVEVRSSVRVDMMNREKEEKTRRIRAVYGVWRERGGAGPWRLHTNPDADEALAYEKANSHNKEDERLRCDRDRWQEELSAVAEDPVFQQDASGERHAEEAWRDHEYRPLTNAEREAVPTTG